MEAGLLLHVVDLSHPHYQAQVETVEQVLRDLELEGRPTLLVHNKIDQVAPGAEEEVARAHEGRGDAVAISALTGSGLDELRERIRELSLADSVELNLVIPQHEGRLLARLRAEAQILTQDYAGNDVHLRVRMDRGRADRWQLERFERG